MLRGQASLLGAFFLSEAYLQQQQAATQSNILASVYKISPVFSSRLVKAYYDVTDEGRTDSYRFFVWLIIEEPS